MCGNLFFCRQFKRRTLTARFAFSGLFALCGVKPRGQRVFTQTDVHRTARVSHGVRGLGFDAVANALLFVFQSGIENRTDRLVRRIGCLLVFNFVAVADVG